MSDSKVPGQLVEITELWDGAESGVSEYPNTCCAMSSAVVREEFARSLSFHCPLEK